MKPPGRPRYGAIPKVWQLAPANLPHDECAVGPRARTFDTSTAAAPARLESRLSVATNTRKNRPRKPGPAEVEHDHPRCFAVLPSVFQHQVLPPGMLGARVFRGAFVGAGLAFIHSFASASDALRALPVVTALRLLLSKEQGVHPHGDHFVRSAEKLTATPLCLASLLASDFDSLAPGNGDDASDDEPPGPRLRPESAGCSGSD